MVAPLSPSSICRRFRPSSSQSEPAGDGSRNAPPHPSALCCVRLLLTDQGGAHLTGVLGLPRNQDVDVGSRIGIGLSKYVDDQRIDMPYEKRISKPEDVFHARKVIKITY